eukprot:tig00000789_g4124.t1
MPLVTLSPPPDSHLERERLASRSAAGQSARGSVDSGSLPSVVVRAKPGCPVGRRRIKLTKRRFLEASIVAVQVTAAFAVLRGLAEVGQASAHFGVAHDAIPAMIASMYAAAAGGVPLALFVLHKWGEDKMATAASVLTVVGAWVRYGGSSRGLYPLHVVGQAIASAALPFFLLSAPTLAGLWFPETGRVRATALVCGLALAGGHLLAPVLASVLVARFDVPRMILVSAAVVTGTGLASGLLKGRPRNPPSYTASVQRHTLADSLRACARSRSLWWLAGASAGLLSAFLSLAAVLAETAQRALGASGPEAAQLAQYFVAAALPGTFLAALMTDATRLYKLALLLPAAGGTAALVTFVGASDALPSFAARLALVSLAGAGLLPVLPLATQAAIEALYPYADAAPMAFLLLPPLALSSILIPACRSGFPPEGATDEVGPAALQRALAPVAVAAGLGLAALLPLRVEFARSLEDEAAPASSSSHLFSPHRHAAYTYTLQPAPSAASGAPSHTESEDELNATAGSLPCRGPAVPAAGRPHSPGAGTGPPHTYSPPGPAGPGRPRSPGADSGASVRPLRSDHLERSNESLLAAPSLSPARGPRPRPISPASLSSA